MGRLKEFYHDEIAAAQHVANEKHSFDYGRKDYHDDILKMIDAWEESLHEKDAEGHSWVQTFRFRVTQVKP